jgi:hypothetical protein
MNRKLCGMRPVNSNGRPGWLNCGRRRGLLLPASQPISLRATFLTHYTYITVSTPVQHGTTCSHNTLSLNVAVEWSTTPILMQKLLGSNLGAGTGYTYWKFCDLFSPFGEYYKLDTITSILILPNLLTTNHSTAVHSGRAV